MSTSAVVIQGTVKPDGTLELEGKVPLPPGKVSVTLEPVPAMPEWLEKLELPTGDPFFEMLRANWAAQARAGKPFRTGEEAQAALRRLRDEVDEEVAEVGRLQAECRQSEREAE